MKGKTCRCGATDWEKKEIGQGEEGGKLGMKNKGAQKRKGVEEEEGVGKEGTGLRKG